jgi:hypothetical protein
MVGIEEIVGDDLLGDAFVGDDESSGLEDSLVGAYKHLKASGKNKQAAALRALINKRVSEGSIVRDVNPSKSREWVVGFDITTVTAGATVAITKQPQVLFRPERLIIPSNIALDFMLTVLKIGKNTQFTATGSVPAVVFSESAFGVRLKLDTCQISMQVILSVQNLAAQNRNFMGALIGPAVE